MSEWTVRYTALAVALAAALGATTIWQYNRASAYKLQVDTVTEQLEDAKVKIKQIQVKTSKAQATAQGNRVKTKEVLDASPEFRDTPTPKPVIDSLCKVIRCS